MPKFILASQSPRRKKLLQQMGLVFEVIPASVDEESEESDPSILVEHLALRKAEYVASTNKEALVIGADTIVVHQGHILGKPTDEADARRILKQLSNETHQVYTGVALVLDGKENAKLTKTFHVQTNVTFSSLTETEIHAYIKTRSPMDKAGAYGIQDDWGSVFVERIEGDYYNVVGLPLNRLYRELRLQYPEWTPHPN